MRIQYLSLILFAVTSYAAGQQVPDTVFRPTIKKAAYKPGEGPIVMVDEAHHNFHTTTNRFKPFSLLLERDGYQVKGGNTKFSKVALKDVRILVISNALSERNATDWSLPTPSAFDDERNSCS